MAFLFRRKPEDRRTSVRAGEPRLTAFYWTGGVCEPLRVRDISEAGAYIEWAQADWGVGTVMHLVLESNAVDQPPPKATFGLWARIIHADAQGMGMEFLPMDRDGVMAFREFLEVVLGTHENSQEPKSSGGWL